MSPSNAGGWNANTANKVLSGRVGQKIAETFPPDEVRKFQVLNAGGQIMPGTHPYEGAGLQSTRIDGEPSFVEKYAPAAATLAGSKLGPLGALAGKKADEFAASLGKESREAAQANKIKKTLLDNLQLGKP